MMRHRKQQLTVEQVEQLKLCPAIAARLAKAEARRQQAALGPVALAHFDVASK